MIGFKTMLSCLLCCLVIAGGGLHAQSLKEGQLQYPRVREAYAETEATVLHMFETAGVSYPPLEIFIRVFKSEDELELWAQGTTDSAYVLVHTYNIQWPWMPGELGPKRQQGDRQVPEGFYVIDRLNPDSRFHLSLGINYPNESDRIRSDAEDLGGDIFIHGSFVSTGCIPIGDRAIEELFITAVDAMNGGREEIPVHIFPCRINSEDCLETLEDLQKDNEELMLLWSGLMEGYSYFEEKRIPPRITVYANGMNGVIYP